MNKPAARIVWVVDQFEEIFTLCNDEKERASFLSNLLYASSIPDGQSTVLLTMRADFLPMRGVRPSSGRVATQQFLVSPMDADMLRQAIEEPARRVRLAFEPGLVEMIWATLPTNLVHCLCLNMPCLSCGKRRRDHTFTLDGYRESGGVKGAIAKTAGEIFKTFNPDEQAIVRRIMLRLHPTRRRNRGHATPRNDGRGYDYFLGADAVEHVERAMADARLLPPPNVTQCKNVSLMFPMKP